MTTADNIMAEALKKAGVEYKQPRIRPRAGEDRSLALTLQAQNDPEPAGIRLTREQMRARRARSIAIALALGALVVVIFAVTIVRLGSGALTGDDDMRPVEMIK